ncbi:hypothetical protein BD289DRAFT_445541 [Coniella lustricola]|uniref:Cryptic loci regulator 2 N-terminal domain-containing protein n=1 Tax=Coniella lustricola TaxID=2025994 RepID=A0A2T2ZUV2_9PEZI|nr:hypothetical protein BD289DRAFT_445541 [Coniella lustricola]
MSLPYTSADGALQVMPNLVQLCRSDGHMWATEAINATLRGNPNIKGQVRDPIPEEMTQITDEESRIKLLEWKEILGKGLAEQLGWPKDSQYLVAFPEGFCLRWHPTGPSTFEVRLYGHPQGFTDNFLYKQPYEFIPHALWLLGESQDHKHCLCEPCHRATGRQIPKSFKDKLDNQAVELEGVKTASSNASEPKPATKKGAKSNAATRKKPAAAAAGTQAVKSTTTLAKAAKEPTPTPKPGKRAVATKQTLSAVPVTTPATTLDSASTVAPASEVPPPSTQFTTPIPAPLPTGVVPPSAAPAARHPSVNDEPTLFRRGEMVWYQQEKAWRIGIIRQVASDPNAYSTIVPLGHALLNIPDVAKPHLLMRPFLTFSVPAMQIATGSETTFNQVDWPAHLNDPAYEAKSEMIGLEASKMAALDIDGSWSTFNQLPPGPKQPKNESSYGGVFLGAEMIRIGDPIRPKDKSKGRLLEVVEISVKAATSVPNPADPANTPPTTTYTLSFRGVEYEANIVSEQGRINAQPGGAIFQKDTAFRTAVAKAGGAKQKCVWVIKSWDTVWQEHEVAGRSYVTDELISVTQGAEAVETAKHTGQFQEASAYLNNRMQNTAARNLGRRPNRRLTVGAAIASAQSLVFEDGLLEL